MHSLDKIREHLDELLGPPSADPSPFELTMRTVVGMAAPALKSILPEEPKVLDEFLEHAAGTILGLRSDGAPLSENYLLTVVDHVERDGAELGERFATRVGQMWHDVIAQNHPAAAAIAQQLPAGAATGAPSAGPGTTDPAADASAPAAPEPAEATPAPAPAPESAPAPASVSSETAPSPAGLRPPDRSRPDGPAPAAAPDAPVADTEAPAPPPAPPWG